MIFVKDVSLADRLAIAGVVAVSAEILNQAANNGGFAAVLSGSTNIKRFHPDIYSGETRI
ncbi:MAG: hypothetical protein CVV39_01680 [Planctomycetes bacterium HGW-Planctomycetes-1]|nr:MAG: hypothetical protein CVV39_01680 [Planctomycetes bacterium HGW-Planctomycetes-1]